MSTLFYVWARISSQFGCLSTSFDFLVSFGLWLICIVNLFDLIADFFSAVIILYIYVNSILISVFINIVITLCYVVQRQFGDWFTCLWSSRFDLICFLVHALTWLDGFFELIQSSSCKSLNGNQWLEKFFLTQPCISIKVNSPDNGKYLFTCWY
jgi:hypothetical protein